MAFFLHLHDTLVPSVRNSYRPHALSKKSLSLFSGLLLSAKLLTVFSVNAAAPSGQAYASAVTPANIIQLTNASRQGYGESNLTENADLDAAAQAKADDMLQQQYFAHTSPAGKTPWDFISGSGYNYIIAGENLALNFFSAESTEQAWMNSPDHRANILNSNFENIGVGVSQGEYNGVPAIFVVQEFGTPLPQSYTIQQANAKPATNVSDASASAAVATPAATTVKVAAVAAQPVVQVQAVVSKSVPVPTLDQPDKTVITGQSAKIRGESQAQSVYLAVNGIRQAQATVAKGTFSTTVSLTPGTNTVTAIASDGDGHVSAASQAVSYITASAQPQVLSAQVNPLPTNGGSSLEYQIVVYTAPTVANVNASYGNQGVMLQPTAVTGEWQATIPASQVAQTQLVIHATDMAGNVSSTQEISFTSNIGDNYAFQAAPAERTIPILGKPISEAALNDMYMAFALIMLVIIGIVIASKVPVADVGMIAQTAGLIALSVIFWVH